MEAPAGVKFDLGSFHSLTDDPAKFVESAVKKKPLV
jgi:hypothetical protein